MQVVPRFWHVSNFQAPDSLHYNAEKRTNPMTLIAYSLLSQNYIFNVHQIITSSGKISIFLAKARTKTNAQNSPKYAISNFLKIIFSLGRGLSPPQIPVPFGRGTLKSRLANHMRLKHKKAISEN